ncbi:D-alanine--D-alanine ligase family protein [Desulfonatronum parangueonense]
MNILIVHNPVNGTTSPDDADVLDQVRTVEIALAELGHEVQIQDWPQDLIQARSMLEELGPDLVFNLVESIKGSARYSSRVPALLTQMNIPYTGCSAAAMERSTGKLNAKQVLEARRLPTPLWLDDKGCGPATFPGVFIVKSVWEHASHGLEADNVLTAGNAEMLLTALRERTARLGGQWFAEGYVPGREFSLAAVEVSGAPKLLNPAELVFTDFPEEMHQVVGYRAKWLEQSFEYRNTVRRQAFPVQDTALLDSMRTLTEACWHGFSLAGYARVDFRVDADNQPWIIDVNANPCLSPDAGFQAACRASGLHFTEVVELLLQAALCPRCHASRRVHRSPTHQSNPEQRHGSDQLAA